MPRTPCLVSSTLLSSFFALAAMAQPAATGTPSPAEMRGPAQEASEAVRAATTAELFYEVLLGELSTEAGQPGEGYALMLDAARRSQSSELYRRATEIALQSRSAQSALVAAQAWQQADPESRDANRFVLRILVALNRIAESRPALERELALAAPQRQVAVINAIPLLYAHASDKAMAARVVEEAMSELLKQPATAANAWTSIGRMRLAAGDRIGALVAARLAHKFDGDNDALAGLVLQLLDEKMAEAEPLLHPYLDGEPLPEISMGYVRYLAESNQTSAALAQMQTITAEQPDNMQALLLQSTLQLQAHELDAAEASLNRFAALHEKQAASERTEALTRQMYLLRSEIAQQRGDLEQAEHWLSLTDDDDSGLAVQLRRALLMARQGRLGEALALLRNLPASNDAEAAGKLQAEAMLLRQLGRIERAYEAQARAAALQPDNDDYLYEQAMLAEKLDRLPGMERLLRTILQRNPKYHHALNALGFSLADRGLRLQEAKSLIEQALELAPGDPYITDSLGWVEYRLGKRQRALQLLQQAMRDQPDPEIAAHLGEVLWKLGDQARAREAWRAGLRLKRDNDTLLKTMRRFGVRP
ncbi:tetratricopeptide repeat protein [Comamonas sp. NLF-1-9]|nr:tetratricopeptide repeat protein [Comamonas sp. NLF-1-9]